MLNFQSFDFIYFNLKTFRVCLYLQMDDTKTLIEESTQSVRIRENTTWYTSEEERDQKNEILSRLIIWDDSFCIGWPEETESSKGSTVEEAGGYIDFEIYERSLYDRIYDYFSLQKNPSFMDESIEIKLFKKIYVTEWSFSNGTIRCYHRWFCNKRLKNPGTSGRISFTINEKGLFEKFKAYALKFEP